MDIAADYDACDIYIRFYVSAIAYDQGSLPEYLAIEVTVYADSPIEYQFSRKFCAFSKKGLDFFIFFLLAKHRSAPSLWRLPVLMTSMKSRRMANTFQCPVLIMDKG
jgi:hypothetical protein